VSLIERVKSAAGGLLGEVTIEPPIWDQFGRIGGNLSPADVSQILREADVGQIARLVDLVHEARQKDGHLHAILQTRELGLQGLEFDCVPPGEEPDEADKVAASQCKRALQQCSTFRTSAVGHLSGESALFGHACSEAIWKLDNEDDELRGLMVPERFKRISCRRFGFASEDGRLLYNPNSGSWASVDNGGIDLLDEYPAGKFLAVRERRINGDVPIREGLARVLMWSALFRNWTVRDWLQLGELGWKPHVHGKYKAGAATADIDRLKRALRSYISSQRTALPDSVEMTVDWPRNAGPAIQSLHHEMAEFLGMEMSKAVLGQTLTTETGSRGAFALGTVHNEIRKDILEADAMEIGAAIKRHVVIPFIRLNFGDRVRVPEFIFLTEDSLDLEAFSNAMAKLRTAGLNIPASYVRDRVGMPPPKAGEELLGDSLDENGEPVRPDPNAGLNDGPEPNADDENGPAPDDEE